LDYIYLPGPGARGPGGPHALSRPRKRAVPLPGSGVMFTAARTARLVSLRVFASALALALLAGAAHASGATFYSQGNLAPDSLGSWNSARDGSGTAPASFDEADSFVVQSGHSLVTSAPWTLALGSLFIESGGALTATEAVTLDASAIL